MDNPTADAFALGSYLSSGCPVGGASIGLVAEAVVEAALASRPEPKKAGRPKNYVYQFKDKSLPFSLNMTFKKSNVRRTEVIDALRQLNERLESEE